MDSNITFPVYSDVSVNTKTFIATLNMRINLVRLYDILEVVPYAIPPAGGRPAIVSPDSPFGGAIISVKLETGTTKERKGVFLRRKGKVVKPFRNSVAMDIFICPDRKLNIKLSANGGLQLTGSRTAADCVCCIEHVFRKIAPFVNDAYTMDEGQAEPLLHIVSVMRNINFSVGVKIDREKLAGRLQHHPQYMCLFAPQFCYAGLNAKIKIPPSSRSIHEYTLNREGMSWSFNRRVPLQDFIDYQRQLKGPGGSKKLLNDAAITFLVFQSGKIIMSGPNSKSMRGHYAEFMRLLSDEYEWIVERIHTSSFGKTKAKV